MLKSLLLRFKINYLVRRLILCLRQGESHSLKQTFQVFLIILWPVLSVVKRLSRLLIDKVGKFCEGNDCKLNPVTWDKV